MAELIILVFFAAIFFWLWMIVDCIYHERQSDKHIWLAIIIVTNVVGAAAYLILRYRENRRVSVPQKPEGEN